MPLIEAFKFTLATANGPPTAKVPPTFRFSVTSVVVPGFDEVKMNVSEYVAVALKVTPAALPVVVEFADAPT